MHISGGRPFHQRTDGQKVLKCLGTRKVVTEAEVDGKCNRDRLMEALQSRDRDDGSYPK